MNQFIHPQLLHLGHRLVACRVPGQHPPRSTEARQSVREDALTREWAPLVEGAVFAEWAQVCCAASLTSAAVELAREAARRFVAVGSKRNESIHE